MKEDDILQRWTETDGAVGGLEEDLLHSTETLQGRHMSELGLS